MYLKENFQGKYANTIFNVTVKNALWILVMDYCGVLVYKMEESVSLIMNAIQASIVLLKDAKNRSLWVRNVKIMRNARILLPVRITNV